MSILYIKRSFSRNLYSALFADLYSKAPPTQARRRRTFSSNCMIERKGGSLGEEIQHPWESVPCRRVVTESSTLRRGLVVSVQPKGYRFRFSTEQRSILTFPAPLATSSELGHNGYTNRTLPLEKSGSEEGELHIC